MTSPHAAAVNLEGERRRRQVVRPAKRKPGAPRAREPGEVVELLRLFPGPLRRCPTVRSPCSLPLPHIAICVWL